MSIHFVCPSNTRFMPYISYYDSNLPESLEKQYIIWDRFCDEDEAADKLIYRDNLQGHQRGILSYIKYMIYLYPKLLKLTSKDKKLVIFGFQNTFFLVPYLLFTKASFVIDVRDYHYLFKLIPNRIFQKASFVAVSSPAYAELFKTTVTSVVCHNLYDYNIKPAADSKHFSIQPINVSYMGAIRDLDSQKSLIKSLPNDDNFLVSFHGVGDIVPELKQYVVNNNVNNVEFTGRYEKEEEFNFYKAASIINMLRNSSSYNDCVALPNRLYSAAFFYRPSLCYEGTSLAEIIKEYSLGLCLDPKDDLKSSLSEYFKEFSFSSFKTNCDRFLNKVQKDQGLFNEKLSDFIKK